MINGMDEACTAIDWHACKHCTDILAVCVNKSSIMSKEEMLSDPQMSYTPVNVSDAAILALHRVQCIGNEACAAHACRWQHKWELARVDSAKAQKSDGTKPPIPVDRLVYGKRHLVLRQDVKTWRWP